ncbi:MAG: hypothetical protein KC713_08125 [Candidatus Omnitrophica bacterium]|nr:hypothetical protein [Candidatus Omnitrophota bacterium]
MDPKYPKFTPVQHKKEKYTGWIHSTTKMEELFTGHTDCDWQYTITIEGQERRKVAPETDLTFLINSRQFPKFIEVKENPDAFFKSETRLHALGYALSDFSRGERAELMQYVAVPILGPKEVARTLCNHMHAKMKTGEERAQKFKSAILEWNHDLQYVIEQYGEDPEMREEDIQTFIKNVHHRMDELDIKAS